MGPGLKAKTELNAELMLLKDRGPSETRAAWETSLE